MRIILVDDEPIILEDLKIMIGRYNNIEITGVFTEPEEALRNLATTKPDCAFLDIEMSGMSGIELAEKLIMINPDIEVVFVTAYNHYAAQAFEVNAIDYILKPIRPDRLDKAVDRLLKKLGGKPKVRDNQCRIKCFGSFEVIAGNRPVKWSRSKSKELLAYLLQYEGRWLTKYKLCDEQWSEYGPEQALAYLQTSIYALRKSLKEIGFEGIKIEYSDDRYILYVRDVNWDLRLFEQRYDEFVKYDAIEAGKEAMDLYSGEYLEGEDWPWSDISREYYVRKHDELKKRLSHIMSI